MRNSVVQSKEKNEDKIEHNNKIGRIRKVNIKGKKIYQIDILCFESIQGCIDNVQ